MQRLQAIWDNTYGLLVDDGQLALGALAGVTATGVFSTLAPPATVQAYAGPVLLGWTCLLVVSNLSVLRGVMPDASWRALWCATALGMMGRRSKEDYGFRCSAAQ